jgi:hypothetical protein
VEEYVLDALALSCLPGPAPGPGCPPRNGEDSRRELLSQCFRDPGIPLDVRTAGALLLLYGQFVSRLARLTAAGIEQHGPDASPHGLWAPALQRMQHSEHARDWKPCPRRCRWTRLRGGRRLTSGPVAARRQRRAAALPCPGYDAQHRPPGEGRSAPAVA